MTREELIIKAQAAGWLLYSSTREGLTFKCSRDGCGHSKFVDEDRIRQGADMKPCSWEHREDRRTYQVTSYSELAYLLREARERMGLTQEMLNDVIGFTDGHVSKLEAGDRRATMPTLLDWAKGLGFDVMLVPSGMTRRAVREIERRVYQPSRPRSRGGPARRLVR